LRRGAVDRGTPSSRPLSSPPASGRGGGATTGGPLPGHRLADRYTIADATSALEHMRLVLLLHLAPRQGIGRRGRRRTTVSSAPVLATKSGRTMNASSSPSEATTMAMAAGTAASLASGRRYGCR
jgi:hypothetical protein